MIFETDSTWKFSCISIPRWYRSVLRNSFATCKTVGDFNSCDRHFQCLPGFYSHFVLLLKDIHYPQERALKSGIKKILGGLVYGCLVVSDEGEGRTSFTAARGWRTWGPGSRGRSKNQWSRTFSSRGWRWARRRPRPWSRSRQGRQGPKGRRSGRTWWSWKKKKGGLEASLR